MKATKCGSFKIKLIHFTSYSALKSGVINHWDVNDVIGAVPSPRARDVCSTAYGTVAPQNHLHTYMISKHNGTCKGDVPLETMTLRVSLLQVFFSITVTL